MYIPTYIILVLGIKLYVCVCVCAYLSIYRLFIFLNVFFNSPKKKNKSFDAPKTYRVEQMRKKNFISAGRHCHLHPKFKCVGVVLSDGCV